MNWKQFIDILHIRISKPPRSDANRVLPATICAWALVPMILALSLAFTGSVRGDIILSDNFDDDTIGEAPQGPDIGRYEQITGDVTVAEVSAGDKRLMLRSNTESGAVIVYNPTEAVSDFEIRYRFSVDGRSTSSGANAYIQQLILLPAGTNFTLNWGSDGALYTRHSEGGTSSDLTKIDFSWNVNEDYDVQILFEEIKSTYSIVINGNVVVADATLPFPFDSLRALSFGQNFASTGPMFIDNITMNDDVTPKREEMATLKIEGENSVAHYPFSVLIPGKIIADISWTGASEKLRAVLHGRRRPGMADPTAPYAEIIGESPLQLVYEVTEADVARGTNWRLVIDDPNGVNDAMLDVKLTLPTDPELRERFEKEKISLRSGDFFPTAELQERFFNALKEAAGDGLHGLIALRRAILCEEIETLERKGVLRQSFLSNRHSAGLIKADVDINDPEIARLVAWILPLDPEDRIDPEILFKNYRHFEILEDGKPTGINPVLNPDGTLNLLVQFYPDTDAETIRNILGRTAQDFSSRSDFLWEATVRPDALVRLAENDPVEWIESGSPPLLLENNNTRATIGVNTVQNATVGSGNTITYGGLTGTGITIGIHDSGVDETHNDLNVTRNVSGSGSHGTHVAGIAAGSGVQSALNDSNGIANGGAAFQWRGMAPSASIVDWGNLVHAGNTLDAITNDSMDVVNHSIALGTDGSYNSDNRLIDQMVRGGATSGGTLVPRIGRTFSGGNAGGNSAQYGNQFGYFANTKQMKNAVVVGNWNAVTNFLAAGSSMGPAYDGRIMPDVVAPGSQITSTNQLNGYRSDGGTSMASPVVAGLHALLLEGWQTTYSDPLGVTADSNAPLPSTLRALLIHTATDIVNNNVRNLAHAEVDSDSNSANGNDGNGNPTATAGPDFTTGWGLVNAQAAVNLMQDSRMVDGVPVPNRVVQDSVNQAATNDYEFIVDSVGNVQVTLAWDDVEAATQSPATTPRLVNDLDLELVSPDGDVFYPWQLGQTILDADGDPIADADQTPGTDIQVQIPINPTTTPATNSDYVPANALTGGGSWVAQTGKDHLNNVEQVFIPNAQVGRWTARVIGFDIPSGAQDYSLVGMPYPDLPELVGSNEDKVGIGGFNADISVEWTVSNVGVLSSGSNFNYEILLSTDFFLGGDVVLPIQSDSRPTDGVISTLSAGASLDVSSTFRITTAQASSLLGIPAGSITVQDLIDNDVFILIHFDSDDDILEHEETNIIPVQASRLVDVTLVMDRSGSMGSSVPVSNGSQTKLAQLKKAANLFLDLMRTNNGDRLGEVSFAGGVTIDFDEPGAAQQVTPLTSGVGGNLADAKQAIDNLNAGGGTNIRDGLQTGLDLLPAGSDRRKVVVFLSDGMKTSGGDPQDAAFLQQFTNQDVKVFSVGFGTEGGAGCSGLDVDLLSSLANTGPEGFFQVAESATELDKFFINALGGAIESELIVDPEGNIIPQQTIVVDAGLGSQDRAASFILTWDDPSANLTFHLRSPSGLLIHPGNAGSFGGNVSFTSETGYAFYKIKPPLPSGPSADHGGSWEMIIHNAGARSTRYLANVLADSTIGLSLATPPPAGSTSHQTGQTIGLNATFTHPGGANFTNAVLGVQPSVPVAGLGDVFSSRLISREELDKVPRTIGDEPLSMLERLGIAFQDKYGRPPVTKRAETPFTLDMNEQSDKAAFFSGEFPTRTPGEYCFLVTADAQDEDCDPIQREILRIVRVKPVVDPRTTRIDLTVRPPGYKIFVTPKDALGHFVGPGHASGITVATDGVEQSGPVEDNLDGSYCIPVSGSSGVVEVTVLGTVLPLVRIEGEIPVPTVVTPPGATNDSSTTIVVGVNDPDSLRIVTGIVLFSRDGSVLPLKGFEADLGSGMAVASVPAGLDPGDYRLSFMVENRLGPPSEVAFSVIGRGGDFPDFVTTVGNSIDSLLNATSSNDGLVILGDLLIKLRDAPIGTTFTEQQQRSALEETSRLLLDGQGLVNESHIPNLLETGELLKIDARDASFGAVNTPAGNDVEVDLSYNLKLRFNRVLDEGQSMVKLLAGPQSFRDGLGRVPAIFDITSTADPGDGGIMIEFEYEEGDYGNEASLILAHRKGDLWMDITTEVDTETNMIRGMTSSLSEFAVIEILPGQEAGEITGHFTESDTIEIMLPDGRFYDIEFSPDMVNWETIAEGVSGTYIDSDPDRISLPRQFYQAVLQRP